MSQEFAPCSMSKIVPEGKFGRAEIVHDKPDVMTRLRAARDGMPLNGEIYTRLIVDGTLWMTDAEFEWRSNLEHVRRMRGDVLIAGLGIGFVLRPILSKSEVKSVTVIERDGDVISLVSPHFCSEKLSIIKADAYEWNPPSRAYDCIYLDIWSDVPNEDNAEEIRTLKKNYRPALRAKGWIAAWCQNRALERA